MHVGCFLWEAGVDGEHGDCLLDVSEQLIICMLTQFSKAAKPSPKYPVRLSFLMIPLATRFATLV